MAGTRELTIIELDGSRLLMLAATIGGGRAEISRWAVVERRADIPGESAEAVGEWVGSELRRLDVPRARVVVSVPRSDVVLKPLTVPALPGVGLSEGELAGVVRLQMVKQLSMGMEGTTVDYALGPGGPGGQDVIAGAMPSERVRWWSTMCEAAGAKARRIGVRPFGVASLLSEASLRRDGPVMGVWVGASAAEYVVIEEGRLVFARSADLDRERASEEIAERIAVEAKRSWMSFRGQRPVELEAVMVLGVSEEARHLAERCAAELGCVPDGVTLPGSVVAPRHMSDSDRAALMPLMGLLNEDAIGRLSLDFLNPRKAPDHSGRRRQRALVGALGLILVCGGAYVVGDMNLARLRADLREAKAREEELRREVQEHQLSHARISGLETWRGAGVDWIAHLGELSDKLPDPHTSTLDEITGRLAVGVTYTPNKERAQYPDGAWAVSQSATFDLAGRMDDRQLISDLRDRLLEEGVYGVESRGADTPERYSLRLATSAVTPAPARAPKTKPGAAGKPEATTPKGATP